MDRVLEIVLNLPEPTLSVWLDQKGQPHERAEATLAETLDGLHGFERAGGVDAADAPDADAADAADAPDASYALTCFDGARKLARAGWRVTAEVSQHPQQQRRVIAMRRTTHAPGVTVCETACDVALEEQAPVDAAFEFAPAALAHALAQVRELKTVATLERRRLRWQRHEPDSAHATATVGIELNVARCAAEDAAATATLRELRVTVRVTEPVEPAEDGQAETVQRAQRKGAQSAQAASGADASNARHAQLASPAPFDTALATLFAVAHELVAALPAFPVLADAIDRVCRTDVERDRKPVRARPIELDGVHTPHQALQAIGQNVAQQWFGNEAVLRDEPDVEFIHQLRVAQRRLKTATRIFPAWIDRAWSTQVEPRLKWLSDLLGQARDWDVFTDETLPGLAQADVDVDAWNATRAAADQRRLEARRQVQQALRSPAYAALALAWLGWMSELAVRGAPDKARGRSLRGYVRKRVAKHFQRVTREPKLTALDAPARHKVRIQAKRLRYMLEFFESLASHRTRREVAKVLSRMQGVLGAGNDAAVALQFLEQLQVEPYQLGFARGWCEALKHHTAQEGERLLGTLHTPKIVSGNGG